MLLLFLSSKKKDFRIFLAFVCFFVLVHNGVSPSIIHTCAMLCYAMPCSTTALSYDENVNITVLYCTVLYCTITMQWFVLDLHDVCVQYHYSMIVVYGIRVVQCMFFSHSRFILHNILIGFCFILVKCARELSKLPRPRFTKGGATKHYD